MDTISFTRRELYDKVWSGRWQEICDQLDIELNGLQSVCDRLNVPFPDRGYWKKLQDGKKVIQDPLPDKSKGTERVTFFERNDSKAQSEQIAALNSLFEKMNLPRQLHKDFSFDKLVLSTQAALQKDWRAQGCFLLESTRDICKTDLMDTLESHTSTRVPSCLRYANDVNIPENQRGVFGDKFGGLNALFTGLAFAGVIVTIILQSQELRLQRKELEATRGEFEKQNATLVHQKFENTFFNLLEQYRSLNKDRFSGQVVNFYGDHGALGASVFVNPAATFGQLKEYYTRKAIKSHDGKTITSLADQIQDEFGQHIKTFERIIEYIYLKKPKNENIRMRYLKFFFAQLTNFELILFFIHFHLRDLPLPHRLEEYERELFDPVLFSPLTPTGTFMTIANRNVK